MAREGLGWALEAYISAQDSCCAAQHALMWLLAGRKFPTWPRNNVAGMFSHLHLLQGTKGVLLAVCHNVWPLIRERDSIRHLMNGMLAF